jgi:pimeloyl-ACP methyl ester carboxylesterase
MQNHTLVVLFCVGQVWDRYVEGLGDGRKLIIPDLRGHGRSTNPDGFFRHRVAAQDLIGLLNELGIDRVVGVGHSSGALALLELSLMAPERLEAMVLIDGVHRFSEDTRRSLAAVEADTMLASFPHFFDAMLEWHERGMVQLRELVSQVREFGMDRNEGAHGPAEIGRIEVPALIVHGDRDDLYPVSMAVELYELLPTAELWIMPGVGHGAFLGHQFDPPGIRCAACDLAGEQFPSVVDGFLRGQRGSI